MYVGQVSLFFLCVVEVSWRNCGKRYAADWSGVRNFFFQSSISLLIVGFIESALCFMLIPTSVCTLQIMLLIPRAIFTSNFESRFVYWGFVIKWMILGVIDSMVM